MVDVGWLLKDEDEGDGGTGTADDAFWLGLTWMILDWIRPDHLSDAWLLA